MPAYLTVAEFKTLSLMPGEFVDVIETRYPGFIDAQLLTVSDWIDARLRKRYLVPFVVPYPVAVRGWLAKMVTPRVWHKRGVDPTDAQWGTIKQDATDAIAEVAEAANSDTGLFDLPLLPDVQGSSAISQGNTRAYSEQSPYSSMDVQGQIGRQEDQYGRGGTST
jgi:hypothetical protein